MRVLICMYWSMGSLAVGIPRASASLEAQRYLAAVDSLEPP